MNTKVFADWSSNRGRPQLQVALALLRLAQNLRTRRVPLLAQLASGVYRVYSLFLIGMDVPVSTSIGSPVIIHHGVGLVVHASTKIGDAVTLRHNTTIGAKNVSDAPNIGAGVDIGPNSVILGAISVGAESIIGAGSVVIADVHPGDVVAGNPAKSIRRKE